jgi:FKBP-type peptidyl-prolyl cis-trans isomerase
MKMGGKYRIWVPSKLAYGARGAGKMIGPNTLLTFDVEPLEIVKE